jgi:hypothetical protein
VMSFNCSTVLKLNFVSDGSYTETGFILFFEVILPNTVYQGEP